MKSATRADKQVVVKILLESFKNDPYLHWITSESKSPNKLKFVIEYVVDETLHNGEIYLSNDNMATALWNSEQKPKFSFSFIWRNLFFLFRFGIKATASVIRKDKFTHNQYSSIDKYLHLYLIGVLPEGQGKGLASKLMNPILNKCSQESAPVILETANPFNVEIYKKKGFSLFNTIQVDDITIFYMKR